MYEELLSTLREYTVFLTREAAERADENIYEGPITLPDALRRAADAIKELQKDAYFHKYNSAFWEDRYYSLADDK